MPKMAGFTTTAGGVVIEELRSLLGTSRGEFEERARAKIVERSPRRFIDFVIANEALKVVFIESTQCSRIVGIGIERKIRVLCSDNRNGRQHSDAIGRLHKNI